MRNHVTSVASRIRAKLTVALRQIEMYCPSGSTFPKAATSPAQVFPGVVLADPDEI